MGTAGTVSGLGACPTARIVWGRCNPAHNKAPAEQSLVMPPQGPPDNSHLESARFHDSWWTEGCKQKDGVCCGTIDFAGGRLGPGCGSAVGCNFLATAKKMTARQQPAGCGARSKGGYGEGHHATAVPGCAAGLTNLLITQLAVNLARPLALMGNPLGRPVATGRVLPANSTYRTVQE